MLRNNSNRTVKVEREDFQLNRTVGGNTDRIKFTGMFPVKTPSPYTFDSKEKRKAPSKSQSSGIASLIDSIEVIVSNMSLEPQQDRSEDRSAAKGQYLQK